MVQDAGWKLALFSLPDGVLLDELGGGGLGSGAEADGGGPQLNTPFNQSAALPLALAAGGADDGGAVAQLTLLCTGGRGQLQLWSLASGERLAEEPEPAPKAEPKERLSLSLGLSLGPSLILSLSPPLPLPLFLSLPLPLPLPLPLTQPEPEPEPPRDPCPHSHPHPQP